MIGEKEDFEISGTKIIKLSNDIALQKLAYFKLKERNFKIQFTNELKNITDIAENALNVTNSDTYNNSENRETLQRFCKGIDFTNINKLVTIGASAFKGVGQRNTEFTELDLTMLNNKTLSIGDYAF